jgi:hypothetical protein
MIWYLLCSGMSFTNTLGLDAPFCGTIHLEVIMSGIHVRRARAQVSHPEREVCSVCLGEEDVHWSGSPLWLSVEGAGIAFCSEACRQEWILEREERVIEIQESIQAEISWAGAN